MTGPRLSSEVPVLEAGAWVRPQHAAEKEVAKSEVSGDGQATRPASRA